MLSIAGSKFSFLSNQIELEDRGFELSALGRCKFGFVNERRGRVLNKILPFQIAYLDPNTGIEFTSSP